MSELMPARSAKEKFHDNLSAIRLLKEIEQGGRAPDAEESRLLAGYGGWGNLPTVFDPENQSWSDQRGLLRQAVNDADWDGLARSTLDSFYTPRGIVSAIYDAVAHLGFQGGKVLEPAAGAGAFLDAMPGEMRSRSRFTLVEKEPVAARILRCRFPNDRVLSRGFEDTALADGQFDLAVGNPPFGNQKLFDRLHRELSKFSIHGFFLAKTLLKVRPGGLMVMVVSRYLMDAIQPTVREFLADHARLLGAVRLPNNAFSADAGTEVTTDVLFFQRIADSSQGNGEDWLGLSSIPAPDGGDPIPMNRYFVDHPEALLGTPALTHGQYRDNEPTILPDCPAEDLPERMRRVLTTLPANVYVHPLQIEDGEAAEISVPDGEKVKVFGHAFDSDGRLVQRLPGPCGEPVWAVKEASKKGLERVLGLMEVRDALVAVLEAEKNSHDDAYIESLREGLRDSYSRFVKRNGAIHAVGNQRVFGEDPDYPLLQGLEIDYDPGISATVAASHGVEPRAPGWKRADIFQRRAHYPARDEFQAETANDALVVSLRTRGRVDVPFMADLLGLSSEAVVSSLRGIIFHDPRSQQFMTRENYLSGNVKRKLREAEAAAQEDPAYLVNVEALESVQPEPIDPLDIVVPMQSPWLPPEVLSDFITHLLDTCCEEPPRNICGVWHLKVGPGNYTRQVDEWGTEYRPAGEIIERILQNRSMAVTYQDQQGRRHTDMTATAAVENKAEAIKRAWCEWIWSDPERREHLAALYNERFNTHVPRKWYGGFLLDDNGCLPGASRHIKLRQNQVNAVWRGISQGALLVDHHVGAGKTYTAIAIAMEQKRLGMIHKPMFVVPNHLVGQWGDAFQELYPGARVLKADKRDFERKRRQRFVAKIATNEWDAVIIGHSQFGYIDMPADERLSFLEDQANELLAAIQQLDGESDAKRTVKQLQRMRERLENRMKRIMESPSRDNTIDYTLLGVDALFVDEADLFKNLQYVTTHRNVGGLGNPEGSQRAFDLFVKARWMQGCDDGRDRGVYFLTGTPISNSIVEMFTLQRYLQWDELCERGLQHFDAWAAVYSTPTTSFEITVTGQWRQKTRFAKFDNMPELLAMYRTIADTVTMDDLQAQARENGERFPVPRLRGGEPIRVIAKRSTELSEYMDSLIKRAENLSNVDPATDNMLKIMSDARKAALDLRLIYPDAPDRSYGKINLCVDNVLQEYRRWQEDRGTQIIFCDLSIPASHKDCARRELAEKDPNAVSGDAILALAGKHSVYDDLKAKLVAKGIPANEIRFIHDARTDLQRDHLFEQVRQGMVRVLIGTTEKLGAGTNVQNRLVAEHHLDCPWRPRDLEQREGRILRQGNELYERDPDGFEVSIYRYGTELTLDSLMWQSVETKCRFINAVRKGAVSTRSIEDVEGEAMEYASMKAELSGNPLILEHFKLTERLRQLEMIEYDYNRRRFRCESNLRATDGYADRAEKQRERAAQDRATCQRYPAPLFIDRNGSQHTDKKAMAEAMAQGINEHAWSLRNGQRSAVLGTYRGFELSMYRDFRGIGFALAGAYLNETTVYDDEKPIPTMGLLRRMENMLTALDEADLRISERMEQTRQEREIWQAELDKGFPEGAELQNMRTRLDEVTQALAAGKSSLPDAANDHTIAAMAQDEPATVSASADSGPKSVTPFRRTRGLQIARRGGGIARRGHRVA